MREKASIEDKPLLLDEVRCLEEKLEVLNKEIKELSEEWVDWKFSNHILQFKISTLSFCLLCWKLFSSVKQHNNTNPYRVD